MCHTVLCVCVCVRERERERGAVKEIIARKQIIKAYIRIYFHFYCAVLAAMGKSCSQQL